MDTNITPSRQLLADVRAGFVRQQTTLNRWCQANGLKRENASKCLLGTWEGPKAREWRQRLLEASRGHLA